MDSNHSKARRRSIWRLSAPCLAISILASSANAAPAADEHYRRGVELARAGQHEAARAEFEAALRLEPHPRVLYNLAKLTLEMGDTEAARGYLRRYLEMDTSSSPPEQ